MEHHSFISTFIFTAINFVLYVILLLKFVFPKLRQSLESKEKRILEELEKSREELQIAKKLYEQALEERKKAEEQRFKVRQEVMELARSEAERIKDEAKKFAKAKLDEVEKTIKMKGEEMKRELEIFALQLAVNLAAEKIKRAKTKEDEKKLFSALLDKIEKMRN